MTIQELHDITKQAISEGMGSFPVQIESENLLIPIAYAKISQVNGQDAGLALQKPERYKKVRT